MKKVEIIILAIIAVFFPLYIIWGNIFPSFEYDLNSTGTHGIQVEKRNFGDKTYLINSYFQPHYLDKVELKLRFADLESRSRDEQIKISAFKNFESATYPLGDEISSVEDLERYLFFGNDSEVPNGTLFSSKEAVYMVSRGEYRPIMNEEVFRKLGFDWDEIKIGRGEFLSELSGEGERIDYASPHPDGTILEIGKEKFLVWEEELLKIQNDELIEKAWDQHYAVEAEKLEAFDTCSGRVGESGRLTCRFKGRVGGERGNAFVFRIENKDVSVKNIAKAHSTLAVSLELDNMKKNFAIFARNTKASLAGIYGGYF